MNQIDDRIDPRLIRAFEKQKAMRPTVSDLTRQAYEGGAEMVRDFETNALQLIQQAQDIKQVDWAIPNGEQQIISQLATQIKAGLDSLAAVRARKQ